MPHKASHNAFQVLKMRTVARTEDTSGAFELIEDERDVGQGPAPHRHNRSDEAFYVLSGRFTFTRGEHEVTATPGTLVFVPRGTRHAYRADEPGSRVLILYVPSGSFEEFMLELDGLLASGLTSAEAMQRIAHKYDSEPA